MEHIYGALIWHIAGGHLMLIELGTDWVSHQLAMTDDFCNIKTRA